MATQFQSAQSRTKWLYIIGSYLFDVFVAFIVLLLFRAEGALLLWAFLWPIMLQIVYAVFMFYGFLKQFAFFKLYDEKWRINAYFQDFKRLRFPVPEDFYHDSENYMHVVAMDPKAPDEARLQAGMYLGVLYSQKLIGPRAQGWFNAITMEKAAQRYSEWVEDRQIENPPA